MPSKLHNTRAGAKPDNAKPDSGVVAGEPAGAAEEDDSSFIVMSQVIGRMRIAKADALSYYRCWRDCHHEAALLRAQLKAVTESRGFRLLQRLHAIRLRWMPPGSRRERLGAAGVWIVRRGVRGSKAMWRMFVRTGPAVENGSTSSALSPVDNEMKRTAHGQLAYAPRDWHLAEETASTARFINLVLLSPIQRSGSTLLQRMCNARKGTLIWGEHGGFLRHFADIYARAAHFSVASRQERDDYFGQAENPNLWIANMCPSLEFVQQAVVASARSFLETMYGQYREHHDMLGFKEVQYGRTDLDLLRKCYPEAQIILLMRNPLDAWRSLPRHWCPSLEDWIQLWNRNVLHHRAFWEGDANCHLIRYEDLIGKDARTMAILAETAKLTREQILGVLAHKIGSSRAEDISQLDRDTIRAGCREPMEALGYW